MQSSRSNSQIAKPIPVVSLTTRGGEIVEMLFRRESGECRLVTLREDVEEHESLEVDGHRYIPYSPSNNLLTHRVLLLPSEVGSYTTTESLLAEVKAFIHRYVDLSAEFEEVAAHYVLLTWVYDKWNELPYLRVRGVYGSGKSRFLLAVGSICWKPIFASGASTVSPLFRLIDEIGGTLVIDEADFFASDERATITKILNNGNARGFPVLRSEITATKEISPRAFNIFGPKIVATRHDFGDEALESRCLTEELVGKQLRHDIPITLSDAFEAEAEALRNKLLKYRFDHVGDTTERARVTDKKLSARLTQILLPLLDIAPTDDARNRLSQCVQLEPRHENHKRRLLEAVYRIQHNQQTLTVGAIADELSESMGATVTFAERGVGARLRALGLRPTKSNGVYRLSPTEMPQLERLYKQYGVRDVGDIGDVDESVESTGPPD